MQEAVAEGAVRPVGTKVKGKEVAVGREQVTIERVEGKGTHSDGLSPLVCTSHYFISNQLTRCLVLHYPFHCYGQYSIL